MRRLRFRLTPSKPKEPPPRWFATHGNRCIAEGVDLLGARDSVSVAVNDLFQSYPKPWLLEWVIPALAARGVGVEADSRFVGPSFVQPDIPPAAPVGTVREERKRRPKRVVLFRLGEGHERSAWPGDTAQAARIFAHVVLALFAPDDEGPPTKDLLGVIDATLLQTPDLRAIEHRRLQMYIKWLAANRPPLDWEEPSLRELGSDRRGRLLAMLNRLSRAELPRSPDEQAKLDVAVKELLRARRADREARRATNVAAVPQPRPSRSKMSVLPAPAPAPALPDDAPPLLFDRKKLRIPSSHRGSQR